MRHVGRPHSVLNNVSVSASLDVLTPKYYHLSLYDSLEEKEEEDDDEDDFSKIKSSL